MIDIRGLNNLIISNIYFIFLQFKMINRLLKCIYIIIINIILFFY